MSPLERPRRRAGVLEQRTPEALVLLAKDSGMYYELNPVGARVWELCDGSKATDALINTICEEFDAPPDVIRADVLALVEDLASERLLEDPS